MINTDLLQHAVNSNFESNSYSMPYDSYIDHECAYDSEVDTHLVIYRNLTGERE
jgi:hypothetical protein